VTEGREGVKFGQEKCDIFEWPLRGVAFRSLTDSDHYRMHSETIAPISRGRDCERLDLCLHAAQWRLSDNVLF